MFTVVKTIAMGWLTGGSFWLKQNAIAFDQFLNTFFFGGWADETMSSALWRMEKQAKLSGIIFRPVVDTLLWFDKDHCRTSYESELFRNQSPPEERTSGVST